MDLSRSKLVKSILYVLAKKNPTHLVRGEVEDLSSILACVRKDDAAPREYSSRFTGAVAVYVNLTSGLIPATDRKLNIVMLKNEKLSNNTINALMY